MTVQAKPQKERTTMSRFELPADISATMEKEATSKRFEKDVRIYSFSLDKSDSERTAIIRLLPPPGYLDHPMSMYVESDKHMFKLNGHDKWHVEECGQWAGARCPICEMVEEEKYSQNALVKDRASKMKVSPKFITNILIVKDFKDPTNNGKIFLYKMPKTIVNLINDRLAPKKAASIDGASLGFEDEKTVKYNPYCPVTGGNLKLTISRDQNGRPTYNNSAFSKMQTKIADSDEGIEAILNKTYSLDEFKDMKLFRSYEDSKKRLLNYLDGASAGFRQYESTQRAPMHQHDDEATPYGFEDIASQASAGADGSEQKHGQLQAAAADDDPFAGLD